MKTSLFWGRRPASRPFVRQGGSCLLAALLWGGSVSHSRAADPDYYARQATWQESLIASLERIDALGLKDGFPAFESGVMHGGDPAREISVPVKGASELYLLVTGCPDVKWGIGDWADARLIRAGGSARWVSGTNDLKVLCGRCENNLTLRSGLDQKLRLGGRTFERGLNVQADSVLRVPLADGVERFVAWIGVDDWAGTNGSVRFCVAGARTAARLRLFECLTRDFSLAKPRQEMAWEREDTMYLADWKPGDWQDLAKRYAMAARRVPPLASQAAALVGVTRSAADLEQARQLYYRSREWSQALDEARGFDWDALRQAVDDLSTRFPDRYPAQYKERVAQLEKALGAALPRPGRRGLPAYERIAKLQGEVESLKREALLANPLLDFKSMVVLKRVPIGDARRTQLEGYGYGEFIGLPRQSSWNNGTMPNVDRWTNEIAEVKPARPDGRITTLYKPSRSALINDLDLHWNASQILFSMPDTNRNWQVHELTLPSGQTRQLTPSGHPDVHNYNGVYLPNGQITFLSTAPLQGVPCNAGVIVGMLYQMGPNGESIRQLTFEQDHDYTPSVLNNGRLLYLRWDYTDTPHIWNRLLMSMNPDGTGQMEYYGANSYWPNAIFFARAIPHHETKVVGIVTGHHEGRAGELFILDPARGRHETNGVVQRIPRKGPPVEPKLEDKLTEHSWPKFLHPWPLDEKYFVVACKPDPDSLWGIYLVDVFDNRVLLREEEGQVLLQPIPLAPRPVPPVIESKTQPAGNDALVYMEDVYQGPGLKDVPPGTVKSLRVFTYHFGYQKLAGIDHRVGADGPWETKRVLGVVPVEPDGSAFFRLPARTPVSFQPLDARGRAVALMRSWMTAMPGESVSCVGCHDRQSVAPVGLGRRTALNRLPSELKPPWGAVAGFSFTRDVQPALDKYCVGCHDGKKPESEHPLPDLRGDQDGFVVYAGGQLDGRFMRGAARKDLLGKYGAVFDPAYVALRQYLRVGGLESDLHLLPPMEFHADTSELIQMLRKGHHGVQLDRDAWDRLHTWIDLNAPNHGTWGETSRIPGDQCERRLELRRLYGGVVENCEAIPEASYEYVPPKPVIPKPPQAAAPAPTLAGWPFDAAEARSRQAAGASTTARTIDLGGGVKMEFVRIPAGRFVMGEADGLSDEQPAAIVEIDRPFWMGRFEVSNEQFRKFDASHDGRFEHRSSWIFSEAYLGWPLNQPRQPVVRVSWREAVAFCRWLSDRLGENVTLPTEAQWEYACRAGTATALSYGPVDLDFSQRGNMGDMNLRRLASEGWRPKSPDLVPKDNRFDDGALVTAEIGRYQPNAWGLHDMHGNAAEWTRSIYRPYPVKPDDGPLTMEGDKVVRGGSWRDRPLRCRSAFRLAYAPWQKVFNVGFRVIIEPGDKALASAAVSSN